MPRGRAEGGDPARALLVAYDLPGVGRWAAGTPRARRTLQSLLFDDDPLIRWRAVEALACVEEARAARGLEPVREGLRRTLWLMNDESGGLLWCGPQVLAAVLARVPALGDEFAPLLPGYLEEEPFRAGARWALWRGAAVPRLAAAAPVDALVVSLGDADAEVRGHAALALRALAPAAAAAPLAALAADPAPVSVFDHRSGELRPTTVGALARAPF